MTAGSYDYTPLVYIQGFLSDNASSSHGDQRHVNPIYFMIYFSKIFSIKNVRQKALNFSFKKRGGAKLSIPFTTICKSKTNIGI